MRNLPALAATIALVGTVLIWPAAGSAELPVPAGESVQGRIEGAALVSVPRPPARKGTVPLTRWAHKARGALWTRAAMVALRTHGRPLTEMVPDDIGQWCPAYATADQRQRAAFWVGLMSALAKYESTYKAAAVGGNGRWYGLLQILPATARGYRCAATTGQALRSGGANLSCAVRILAHTVPRDGVVHGRNGRWLGVSADWGPMRVDSKRREMTAWLRDQPYCQSESSLRPRLRPFDLTQK